MTYALAGALLRDRRSLHFGLAARWILAPEREKCGGFYKIPLLATVR